MYARNTEIIDLLKIIDKYTEAIQVLERQKAVVTQMLSNIKDPDEKRFKSQYYDTMYVENLSEAKDLMFYRMIEFFKKGEKKYIEFAEIVDDVSKSINEWTDEYIQKLYW